jgi:ubiquinone/menaquinone biosynthesis C-methylase UbiE
MTEAERIYYDKRAAEYDDWYLGTGLYSTRVRPGWQEELDALRECLRALRSPSVLDVACGTGFLTQHVPGCVTALDQSQAMLRIAGERLPARLLVRGDALRLPFGAHAFDCLIAAHFYGHLDQAACARFLAEARRIAGRLLVVDAAWREDVLPEETQQRTLQDGSRHTVYKRYFTPAQLIAELGGGRMLHAGRWFVAVLA